MHASDDEKNVDASNVADVTHATTKKKIRFKGPEMVLVAGLAAIIGGLFWVISGGLDEPAVSKTQKAKTTTQKPEVNATIAKREAPQTAPYYEESKVVEAPASSPMVSDNQTVVNTAEETPPFVYENEAEFGNENLAPPPEAYEKNLTKIAKQTVVEKAQKSQDNKNIERSVETPSIKRTSEAVVQAQQSTTEPSQTQAPTPKVALSPSIVNPTTQPAVATVQSSYVCSMMKGYSDMVGKEIMYYLKDPATQTYLPAYTQKNWDESGIWIKEKFIATQVDVDERMVEVRSGKWIPALEFMTCTLIEESMR